MSKYGTIVQSIIDSIRHGSFQPGDSLPSLRQQVQLHQVSLNTARRAYYELERLGHVEAHPRSGYVVAAGGAQAVEPISAPLGEPFIQPVLYDIRPLTRAFVSAMRRYDQALAEPGMAGLPALRRQIAQQAHAEGWSLQADEVLITCGGMEALSLAIAAATHGITDPCVAVLMPTFPGLLGWLSAHGMRVLPVLTNEHDEIDDEPLRQELAAGQVHAIALMTAYCHPHGRNLSVTSQQKLLRLAQQFDIALIEDDAYRHLGFADTVPLPLKAQDHDGRVLLCATFSKSLAPGYRVGWLAPGRYATIVQRLKLAQTLTSPLPNQLALAELLAGGRHLPQLARLREHLADKVGALEAALRQRLPSQTRLASAEGGYFVWLSGLPCDSISLTAAAAKAGIVLAPGTLCWPGEAGQRALRLNASYFDANRQQAALDWLARALHQDSRTHTI